MHDTREEALPSLLPSMDRIEDIDDMTVDTFILAGRPQGETLKPPQVVFTKNSKTGNEKWQYDENCDFNAGEFGVGVVEEFEEGSIIEDEAVNIIDNMIKKEIILPNKVDDNSQTSDTSSIVDSTHGYFYYYPFAAANEKQGIVFDIQNDNDLNLINQSISRDNNDEIGESKKK